MFFSPKSDAPRYVRGHAVTLAMVGFGTCVYAFLWFWYERANRQRQKNTSAALQGRYRGMDEDQLKELGDESPHYVYTI